MGNCNNWATSMFALKPGINDPGAVLRAIVPETYEEEYEPFINTQNGCLELEAFDMPMSIIENYLEHWNEIVRQLSDEPAVTLDFGGDDFAETDVEYFGDYRACLKARIAALEHDKAEIDCQISAHRSQLESNDPT